MLKELNLNKRDYIYLLFITVISTILVIYYMNFNYNFGIYCSDVFIYLLNALYYTGTNIGVTKQIFLSPVICFLTSLLFKLGLQEKLAIYIVTSVFAILGNIGLYLLLKRFFNETLSLTGTIIYSTLSLNLTWLANGTLDIPGVAVTIWIMLFLILAIKENPKYFSLTIPLFVIGVFTRYTVILILPAMLLYYVYEKGFTIEKADLKYIIIGILISAIIFMIIFTTISSMGQNKIEATNQVFNGISGKQGSNMDPAYNTDKGYYLMNYLNFISNSNTSFIKGNPTLQNATPLSWLFIGLLLIGGLLWLKQQDIKIKKKDLIPIALLIMGALSFGHVSSVLTMIFILLGLYLIGKDCENKIPYFMLGWFLVNFIFFSYYDIKVNRYIITTFPPLIYFFLCSINEINEKIKINGNILPIILITLFLIQGFAFTATFEQTNDYKNLELMSNYVIENHPDYVDGGIGVYNIRPYSWYLCGKTLGIKSNEPEKIDQANITYYISDKDVNLTNFTEIKQIDKLHLFKRTVE